MRFFAPQLPLSQNARSSRTVPTNPVCNGLGRVGRSLISSLPHQQTALECPSVRLIVVAFHRDSYRFRFSPCTHKRTTRPKDFRLLSPLRTERATFTALGSSKPDLPLRLLVTWGRYSTPSAVTFTFAASNFSYGLEATSLFGTK